jgi:predicted nucleotidyltransferase
VDVFAQRCVTLLNRLLHPVVVLADLPYRTCGRSRTSRKFLKYFLLEIDFLFDYIISAKIFVNDFYIVKMKNYRYLTKQETAALNLLISRLKNELKDYLIRVQLFGSKAKGNFKPDSDIDVLLIVKDRTEKVLDKIAEIHFDVDLKYDPNISLIIFSDEEYRQNQRLDTPFIKNIQRESIAL